MTQTQFSASSNQKSEEQIYPPPVPPPAADLSCPSVLHARSSSGGLSGFIHQAPVAGWLRPSHVTGEHAEVMGSDSSQQNRRSLQETRLGEPLTTLRTSCRDERRRRFISRRCSVQGFFTFTTFYWAAGAKELQTSIRATHENKKMRG